MGQWKRTHISRTVLSCCSLCISSSTPSGWSSRNRVMSNSFCAHYHKQQSCKYQDTRLKLGPSGFSVIKVRKTLTQPLQQPTTATILPISFVLSELFNNSKKQDYIYIAANCHHHSARRLTESSTQLYLHLLWGLDLNVSRGIAIQLFKQVVELPVRDYHLHLLLWGSISMTNDTYHTAQLVPGSSTQKWFSTALCAYCVNIIHLQL